MIIDYLVLCNNALCRISLILWHLSHNASIHHRACITTREPVGSGIRSWGGRQPASLRRGCIRNLFPNWKSIGSNLSTLHANWWISIPNVSKEFLVATICGNIYEQTFSAGGNREPDDMMACNLKDLHAL